ncbi:DNA mismatch repair protein [Vibrio sp. SCSIO 43135]|uniref:DNA mismatch repair protein n=1 Tax=Vibrio sp. SCSIO 43135 TaxID=2819096 RepID=UPI00207667E1|nr:DNA mismatch repair protein [Vibrio sp. SCSIO 43135]USD43449.1 DNA mismatch repair protein [Vibrio sp. SCSIO 43135]
MSLRVPPAWVLVLIGLILNVLAILMSSIVLDELGDEIAQLSESKMQNQYSIQLAWKSVETLERKREALLQHVQLSPEGGDEQLQQALQGQLQYWVGKDIPAFTLANLPELMMLINKAQQTHRDAIDEFYLDNLSITEVMQALNDRIAWYKNIGLFLQVFGLALILARDLARKE